MVGGFKSNKIVAVAMSGGLDSSVAAALVKKAYTKPLGVFLKLEETGNRCCSLATEKRGRLVADQLEIPFYVIHVEREFQENVIDYFIDAYGRGTTPNPCVVCNKKIKFGLLLNKVRQLFGADYLATGHYARLRRENPKSETQNPKLHLYRGSDKKKDQSYFLWQLTQEQLKHILFPVGAYTKERVMGLAKKFSLPVTKAKESQEACFIKTSLDDFLEQHIPSRPGEIINVATSQAIGQHRGLAFYTIGQRRGIKLAGGPFYVVGKEPNDNRLLVANINHAPQFDKREIIADNINWLAGWPPLLPMTVQAQIRYGHPAVNSKLEIRNSKFRVVSDKPVRAVTPGQSIVFYNGEEVLGGGIISCPSV